MFTINSLCLAVQFGINVHRVEIIWEGRFMRIQKYSFYGLWSLQHPKNRPENGLKRFEVAPVF